MKRSNRRWCYGSNKPPDPSFVFYYAGRPKRLFGPKLGGFRCAFVYRPGIRRYVGASLQWDQVRELDEISGKRVADMGRRNFRFRGLHLEPSRIAFELRPRYPPGRDNSLLETSSKITLKRIINTYLAAG